MNTPLRVAAAAAMGIGLMFAVPTVVISEAHACTGGSVQANAICAGCALGGQSPACAGDGIPAAQPQAAPAQPPAAPPPPLNLPGPFPEPPANVPSNPPLTAPTPPPGISPGHGEPSWCGGVRPPGTDSQCPITGLTPGINH